MHMTSCPSSLPAGLSGCGAGIATPRPPGPSRHPADGVICPGVPSLANPCVRVPGPTLVSLVCSHVLRVCQGRRTANDTRLGYPVFIFEFSWGLDIGEWLLFNQYVES